MRINPFDDLATSKPPFNVIACLAVLGRGPLLYHTIRRLYQKNGCFKVICSGHLPEDKVVVESAGGIWIEHDDQPLGSKWNASFREAQKYEPDAVLYVGSSDWLSDDWLERMELYVRDFHFVGTSGFHLIDLGETKRLCYWPGYAHYPQTKSRSLETIGIGRMLSRHLMDKLNWEPFEPHLRNSLDFSMKTRAAAKGFKDVMVNDLISLSVSTDKWVNMHKFDEHYRGRLLSQHIKDVDGFVNTLFPEINEVFSTLRSVPN